MPAYLATALDKSIRPTSSQAQLRHLPAHNSRMAHAQADAEAQSKQEQQRARARDMRIAGRKAYVQGAHAWQLHIEATVTC